MKYTVETQDGCTLVSGALPASDLLALMNRGPKGSVISTDLARMAGVSFAWGLPDAVDALEGKLRAEKVANLKATLETAAIQSPLSFNAKLWLEVGAQGLSSCAMFWRFTGVKPDCILEEREYVHPNDPSDLRRCMLLLDQVPEFKPMVGAMAGCSPEWSVLVEHWDALTGLLEDECPEWRKPDSQSRTPKTYARMRDLLAR